MSSFLGTTPVLRLSIKNHFLGRSYPEQGLAVGVVDTGFDGFVAVPEAVFKGLGMDALRSSTEKGVTAGGATLDLRAFPGTVDLQAARRSFDGLVVAGPGIDEVLVGTALLRRLKLTLNYCAGVFRAEPCG